MVEKFVWLSLFMGLTAMSLCAAPQMSDEKATQTVTGCLEKGTENHGFYIISKEGKHWELYPNSDVSLADHVGHTVTVTGTVAHRSAAQEEKSQPHEKKETGSREHADLQVSSMKHVSETCGK
ncbi:MAG TPA: hypothetical protein VFA68_22130 [Terriglobales bacterium]|nr:hypothetical protein [Terriglobales bacterium]